MASRQKHSEGISLLSMYNDEDDEEMEDIDEQQQQLPGDEQRSEEQSKHSEMNNKEGQGDAGNDAMVTDELANQNSTPKDGLLRPLTPQQQLPLASFSSSPLQQQQQQLQQRRSGRGRLTIVDYGHDEVAMSPELEEGEFDEELQTANGAIQEKTPLGIVQVLTPGIQATPQSSEYVESSQHDELNNNVMELESAVIEGTINVSVESGDPLNKFLPPPTKEKCPEELQRKIERFIGLKKIGRSFNAEVRNRKDYRNPDFLLHAVTYQEIDEIGSCFSKDVFDPYGYDKSDYYYEIEADMRRDKERKEQELKRSPKVEFVSGGNQPGTVLPPSKFSVPIPVAAACGLPSAADSVARDSRQNKKSKWDKVDGDIRSTLPPSGQDSLATAAAHAALLSAANVGAGYTAFVQQKRREAEEKRSSEKRVERRS